MFKIILSFLVLPTFISSSDVKTIDAIAGDTVTLPCIYGNVDQVAVIWERTATNGDKAMLFSENQREIRDDRFEYVNSSALPLGDYSIRIRTVRWHQDGGFYECLYLGEPPLSTKFELNVKSPPVISIAPEKSPYVVELNKPFYLQCTAKGEPKPTISWKRKDQSLPGGEAESMSEYLRYDHATEAHAGTYVCTASNNVGPPIEASSEVQIRYVKSNVLIHHEPENPRISQKLTVTCVYDSIFKVIVDWYINGQQVETNSYSKTNIVTDLKHSILSKDHVEFSDYGNYTCVVRKKDGTFKNTSFIGGPPGIADIKSELQQSGVLKVFWTVQSISPVLETIFTYRKAKDADFMQAVVATEHKSGTEYRAEHSIEKYAPDTEYEVQFKSRNIHGWSEVSSTSLRTSKVSSYKQQSETVTIDASRPSSGASMFHTTYVLSLSALILCLVSHW